MSKQPAIDLFVEDQAHELFFKALIARLLKEERKEANLQVRTATGGHGRVVNEYRTYLKLLRGRRESFPNLIVVAVDANCSKPLTVRQEIEKATDEILRERIVVACPDPHIERWYTDPIGFGSVIGRSPTVKAGKCERDYYKHALATAVSQAGHIAMLGGIEFATELVEAMDLFKAGKDDKALHAFISHFRSAVQSL